jgi:hypothetical protein
MAFTNIWGNERFGGNVSYPEGGTQFDNDKIYNQIFTRLYSPDEYTKLPERIKNAFGSYMIYLNSFTSKQKKQGEQQDAFQKASKGEWEPQQYQITSGLSSGSQRIPSKAKTSATSIPSTTSRKDIYGNVIIEPVSSGIRRDIRGNVIPESLEAYQAGEELKYAIPSVQEEALGAYRGKHAKRVQSESVVEFPQRQEAAMKLQQAQERIDQGNLRLSQNQQRLDDKNAQLKAVLSHREYMEAVKQEGKKEILGMRDALETKNIALKNEFQANMAQLKGEFPNTKESQAKQDEIAARQIKILDYAAQIAATKEEREQIADQQNRLDNFRYWLRKVPIEKTILSKRQEKDLLKEQVAAGLISKDQAKNIAIQKGWDQE